jgi:hypothetical protein
MEEDFEILSTQSELEGFEETTIYKDYAKELDVRITALTMCLRDAEMKFSGREYDMFRGGIKNMEQMKEIFRDLAGGKASQDNATRNQ